MVIKDVAEIMQKITGGQSKFVATEEKNPHALSAEKVFAEIKNPAGCLFFITWGPLVEKHANLIKKNIPDAHIIYYAQSFGWKIKVPRGIPIVCVSKYVMSKWKLRTPENFCTYISPPLHACFKPKNDHRDIDILVHKRKQNSYCLEKLLPALEKENLQIEIIDKWIPQENFAQLLGRTKIFLYVTALHKAGLFRKLAEGFGLPALEAASRGALVASNLLGGVTDFLVSGENCIKLQEGSLDFDVAQIKTALKNFVFNEKTAGKIADEYSFKNISAKWESLLTNLG